ncbi:MAG: hypothetical protein HN952_02635 [Candidatus Cloacimonetes bacterium]|jgi:hypothetical protein|nr:hypothetical protein [Candidatus Cloacimonadota bacterium]MBT6993830.1 hypothetical protein [Candidatus Cloacimonadota bacterium]
MGRLRKTRSRILRLAKTRLAGIIAINPALDLGNGKDVPAYKNKIKEMEDALAIYNQKLAELDELYNALCAKENILCAFNTEILSAIKGLYGRDSNEYEQAGGTRYSERKSYRKNNE